MQSGLPAFADRFPSAFVLVSLIFLGVFVQCVDWTHRHEIDFVILKVASLGYDYKASLLDRNVSW